MVLLPKRFAKPWPPPFLVSHVCTNDVSTFVVNTFCVAVFVAAVNIVSVRASGRMAVVCTIGKVAALGVIIVGGMVKLGQGRSAFESRMFRACELHVRRTCRRRLNEDVVSFQDTRNI